MSSDHLTVRARVTVTLEITISDCWSGDVQMQQVEQQAAEKVTGMFAALGNSNAIAQKSAAEALFRGARFVGKPSVEAVMTRRNT